MSHDNDRLEAFERYLKNMVDINLDDSNDYFKGYLAALEHVKEGFQQIVKGEIK